MLTSLMLGCYKNGLVFVVRVVFCVGPLCAKRIAFIGRNGI